VKITLTSDDSVRLEPVPGPLTIEAPSSSTVYSPFHMLGSSLAVCTHSMLASWATNVGVGTDGLVIDVQWSFAEQPHRVGELHLTFDWPELPANRRATAERVAALCPIHATLHHLPTVTVAQRRATHAEPSRASTPVVSASSASAPVAGSPT
jgi:uncharacterized OsmC-like protein